MRMIRHSPQLGLRCLTSDSMTTGASTRCPRMSGGDMCPHILAISLAIRPIRLNGLRAVRAYSAKQNKKQNVSQPLARPYNKIREQ